MAISEMIPTVSICLPTYCQTEFLRKTLDSIVAQEFQDYELIVSDDSPDNSVERLLQEYDFSDKLIYSKNVIALGSPANWNQAIELSKGRLIKIMHHDDWFSSPTSLGEFVSLINANPQAGFAFSGVNTKSPNARKYLHQFASRREVDVLQLDRMPLMLRNCIGPPSSTIVKRECFKAYRENLQWLVDVYQYSEILEQTSFAYTPKALIYSTTDAEHQITNTCQQNPGLLLYEYLCFFNNFEKLSPTKNTAYLNYLIELVLKYGINNEREIRNIGFDGAIHPHLIKVMNFSNAQKQLKLLELKIRRKINEASLSSSR
ncbi:hypothetical protein AOC10_01635 [Polynucleobacter asymbioticus]|uniref:glycosyltransferase family 2 protein n=1 Tax=Polynucleobacter asymbioticus TaxID=576611 RepID=UPI0008FB166B|nr:glycosyltransferase family 2 protein [Polynucleobacter asymbioticus]APC05319.1 hypothetical protein AOC10_01635 [Polynucleobacter asymbioticus]